MHKEIVVSVLKDVDGLKFGTKRSEVRKTLGEYTEFKKSLTSKNTTDDFGFCHVYYNTNDEFEAIEFFGDINIFIGKEKIYPTSVEKASKIITDFNISKYEMLSYDSSIGITLEDDKMVSILFGRKDYYK